MTFLNRSLGALAAKVAQLTQGCVVYVWFQFTKCYVSRCACAGSLFEAKTAADCSSLTEHALSEKPHACSVCDKQFKHRRFLIAHQRAMHSAQPFLCTMCDTEFCNSELLDEHKQVHSGAEKPYLCTLCGTQFKLRQCLTDHKRIHTEEKSFMCTECGKLFRRRTHLNIHLRVHSGEKPFVCTVCDKRFTKKSSLDDHRKTRTHCEKLFPKQEAVHQCVNTREGRESDMSCQSSFDPAVHYSKAADVTECSLNDLHSSGESGFPQICCTALIFRPHSMHSVQRCSLLLYM